MLHVPSLETERLVLRGHRTTDLDDCAAMWADPEVTRYIGGRPSSREQTWARLVGYAGQWALLGFGYWLVADRSTGRFVGEVGFADFHREIHPGFDGSPEIGWALARWAHGRGLATEAVRAVVAWGDRRFGDARTVCMIDPAHAASIRVATRCGYAEAWRTEYRGAPTVVYARGGEPRGPVRRGG